MKTILNSILLLTLLLLPACSKGSNTALNNIVPTDEKSDYSSQTNTSVNNSPEFEHTDFQADILIDYGNVTSQSPPFYGVNGWWTDQDAQLWIDRYKELNVNIVRLPILQFILEPQNDNDNPDNINWENFLLRKTL